MDLLAILKKILKKGNLTCELELEQVSIIDRKLRLLAKEFPELNVERKQLRTLIKSYEDKHWVGQEITDKQVEENDLACNLFENMLTNSINKNR